MGSFSSEYLEELISRVLGDFIKERFIITIAVEIHVCANITLELFQNWSKFLQRIKENNIEIKKIINFSASKTVVCLKKTKYWVGFGRQVLYHEGHTKFLLYHLSALLKQAVQLNHS